MYIPTLCAQVARRLGEPLRSVRRRGFQPLRPTKRGSGPTLSAVGCPFCGGQVLVAPKGPTVEAECHGCDTAFTADRGDVFEVSLADAERPKVRRFLHEVW
jgi:hypothetical protein